jgi:hypothetical protein
VGCSSGLLSLLSILTFHFTPAKAVFSIEERGNVSFLVGCYGAREFREKSSIFMEVHKDGDIFILA